jgi:hypothetical protein
MGRDTRFFKAILNGEEMVDYITPVELGTTPLTNPLKSLDGTHHQR